MFRNKLKKYGITEHFIQQHGNGNEEESLSSRLNVSADESDSRSSRYEKENVQARSSCNATDSGKIMNSTGDGEPRTSCGLVVLHYIILLAYATVFSKEKTNAADNSKVRCNYTLAIS